MPPFTLDPADFDPASVPAPITALNDRLAQIVPAQPRWWDVGAAEYRRMRREGGTHRPAPTLLDAAESHEIPSRDAGRTVHCRVIRPQDKSAGAVKGVFMHIHGGGWVTGDEYLHDVRLQAMADDHGLVCVNVGYRLAPEHPFPAGPQDCFDVAEWLVTNSSEKFGAPLTLIGGDSAGAHLTLLTALHLLNHPDATFSSSFHLKVGLLLYYGCFDMSWTPSALNMLKTRRGVTLDPQDMHRCRAAFLPDVAPTDTETFRRPDISPLYADLEPLRGKLPAALFVCGTEDCLLDDTLFMSVRWLAAGGETVVEIVPGAQHGFINWPRTEEGSGAERGMTAVDKFIAARI